MSTFQKNVFSLRTALHVLLTFMLIAPALCLRPSTVAHADTRATFSVNTFLDTVDVTPGDSFCVDSNGNCSLRAAIMETNALLDPDAINIPAGTYRLTRSGIDDSAISGDLDIIDDLIVTGESASVTIIDAADLDRVFHVTGGHIVSISGVTIRGGQAMNANGGGIYNNGGSLTLTDCTITDNQALGADGTPLVSSGLGGGIYNLGTLIVTGSTVSGNQALGGDGQDGQINGGGGGGAGGGLGGGIFNSGTVTFTNSTISGNGASGGNGGDGTAAGDLSGNGGNGGSWGGAGGIPTQSGGDASGLGGGGGGGGAGGTGGPGGDGNFGGGGGGGGAGPIGTGGNTQYGGGSGASSSGGGSGGGGGGGAGLGGGIFNENGEFDLINCTISNNMAAGGLAGSGGNGSTNGSGLGGGLFNYLGNINYANSIIFGNTADPTEEDCDNLIAFDPTSQNHNLVGAGTGCPATGMNDIVTADARLGALADNGGDTYTHALLPGSPAVNKGPATCVSTDQRGVDRPQGAYCDIGAYEATSDLSVSVDVSNPTPNPGDLITYTVTITNSGALTATNVIVSDTLPDGLTFVGPVTIDPPQPGATVAVTGGDLPSLVSGMAVDAGVSVTVTFVLLVDLYQADGTEIENVVSVIGDEVITPETGDISITVRAPRLFLTKTATPDDPPVGTLVVYEIVVQNQGTQNATNVVLSDTLDALLIPAGPVVQEGGGGMVTYADGVLLASGLTITQDESITFTLPVVVSYGPGEGTLRMDVPDGTVISNTVHVSRTGIITALAYTEGIIVRAPTLVPVKSVSDDTPLKGQTITYTIVVENSGSSDASNVTISDAIPEGLTFVENSAMLESSGGTVVLPGGSAPLLAHSVPIASQESITLTFAATVNDDVADGTVITNTAYVTSTEVAAPKMAESTLTVRYPILSLTKTASDPTPALGHVFEYEIVVVNGGSADATNAVISDDLPQELTFVGPVTLEPLHPEATVAQTADDLPTLVSGLTLLAFESVTVTLPVSVNIDLEIGAVISNVATVTSTEVADPAGNEGDPTDITIQGTELVLTKTASNEHPNPGDVIAYTIVVENRGPVDATDAVISDTLSEDLTFINRSVTITPAHPEATLAQTADDLPILVSGLNISVGARITVVFQVSVNQGLTDGLSIFNIATIVSTEVPIPEGNEEEPTEIIVDDTTIPYFPVGPQILIRPAGGEIIKEVRPVFEWLDASDNGVVVSYTLSITGASDHSFVAFTTTFIPTEDLVNGNYFWTVVAYDSAGNSSDPIPSETFTVRLTSDMYMPFISRNHGP
jgi:uncharacterized repeat protein (TIGR01451 family)/CSLREA domain-containing protein